MAQFPMHWRAMALAAATTAATATALAQTLPPPEPADGAEFSATVVVTRAVVDPKGALVRELPTSRYQLAQFADGRMRLTMLPQADVPSTGPIGDAFAGITVENDVASGHLQVRDKAGRSLSLDRDDAQGWMQAAQSTEPLVAPAAERPGRRSALERRFGRSRGKVRGLDRYLSNDGTKVHEVLVDPESALPAEVNVADGKTLVEHHRFEYARVGRGWVRTRVASETAMPGTPSQRLVAVSTMGDVKTKGGAR